MFLEDVIVGSCPYALLMSYAEKIPIVIDRYSSPDIDLEFKKQISVESLKTKSVADLWSMLKFLLSMEGLVINPRELEYLRIENDTLSFRNTTISFKKCHLFPSFIAKTELDVLRIENQNAYKTSDFMRLKFCNASNIDKILPKDTFIDTIKCYGKKDVLAVSTLSKEQLTNFDYSDTIVRFISEKELLKDKRLYRPKISLVREGRRNPKLTVVERRVSSLEETVYKSSKKVKYYDRKKRNDILKAYRRNHPSFKSKD